MDSSSDLAGVISVASSLGPLNDSHVQMALSNTDILREIFGHLEVFEGTHRMLAKTARSDLIAAAMTCNNFLDPALDLLWYTLDSFLPLLTLLPSVQNFNQTTYLIQNRLREPDWVYFDGFSRRVRRFVHTPSSNDESVTPDIFLRLHQIRKAAIFPALRYLYCSCTSLQCISALSCITSTINDVELSDITDKNAGIASLLCAIPVELPHLMHLSLTGNPSRISIKHVQHLQGLRSLRLSGMGHLVDHTLIKWMDRLEGLEELTLDMVGSSIQTFNPGFAHLRKLDITANSPFLASWLQSVSSLRLSSVSLGAHPSPDNAFQPSATYWEGLTEILAAKWGGTLQKVCLSGKLPSTYNGPVFAPLLQLSGLVSFQWVIKRSVHFSDEQIEKMALAWPNLHSLGIYTTDGDRSSFNVLSFIAQHCPKLSTLVLDVDVQKILPFENSKEDAESTTVTAKSVSKHGLLELSVGDYVIKDPLDAALRLDRLFPRLESFRCDTNPSSRNCQFVEGHIKMFHKVRAEERLRYGLA